MSDEPVAQSDGLLAADDTLLASIAETATRALNSGEEEAKGAPRLAELLEEVYSVCRGPKGVASLLMKQYCDIEPGKPGRTKILEAIMRATYQNTQLGDASKTLDEMDVEELQEALNRKVTKLCEDAKLKVVNPDAA